MNIEKDIRHFRKQLDKDIKNLTGLAQVQYCLALLNRKKESKKKEEIEILAKLIKNQNTRKGLYYSWDNKQKAHYSKAYPIIVEWNDFFLSYTSRDLPQTNTDFQEKIKKSFRNSDFNSYKDDVNVVAELIAQQLIKNGLQGFYDKSDIKYGDNITEKIKKHCKSCFVFVQLIEKRIFDNSYDEENWCYNEFKEFDDWISKHSHNEGRYQFFLLQKDVFPVVMSEDYEVWKKRIKETKYCIISELNRFELREKIYKLAEEIYSVKNRILKEYLEDFI